MASKRLLLLSSSTVSGSGYLDYAEKEIRDFLGKTARILFVPYALHDHESYTKRVSERLARMSYTVEGLHCAPFPTQAIANAEAIFIGGGNTFRLLKQLYDFDLLSALRQQVAAGTPYIGSSAGSNIAGPTIRTTNDMPIVEPPSFVALGFVPFQINPHYLDADPHSTHMGETREERISQFLEENEIPVIGLREGSWLRMEEGNCRLGGASGARWFCRGKAAQELAAGAVIGIPTAL
jgi:dipeptidase E